MDSADKTLTVYWKHFGMTEKSPGGSEITTGNIFVEKIIEIRRGD